MIDFDAMDKDELRRYLDFIMWHYRVVDSFWYIYLEEEYGAPTADHFNERVWDKCGQLGARQIVKRFNIEERGLKGFAKAIRYFPWAIMVGYHIEERPDEVIITVPECPTQRARLNRGLGEYACGEMHRLEFVAFIKELDPSIEVECVHAPPDPHPPERFCKWRFTVGDGSTGSE